jgi:hypothetical protein
MTALDSYATDATDPNSDAQVHEKDVFEVGETFPFNGNDVEILSREVRHCSFEEIKELVADHYAPSDYNEAVKKGAYVLHEVDIDGAEYLVTATGLVWRATYNNLDRHGEPDIRAEIRADDDGFQPDQQVEVNFPSVGARSLSAAEAESLSKKIRANASDSAFRVLLGGAETADDARHTIEEYLKSGVIFTKLLSVISIFYFLAIITAAANTAGLPGLVPIGFIGLFGILCSLLIYGSISHARKGIEKAKEEIEGVK